MNEPLYKQIVASLKDQISRQEPNTPIPSERQLEKELNASRMTVRKAIDILVEEGYLYRIQNVGTYVADYKLHKKVLRQQSFEVFGEDQSYKIVNFKVKANPEIAYILETDSEQPLLQIVRLNTDEEGRPESVDEIFINKNLFESMRVNDINELLKFGQTVPYQSVNQRFVPMKVPASYANLLKVEMGTPIICVKSKVYMQDGRIFAYIMSYYSPNKNIEVTF